MKVPTPAVHVTVVSPLGIPLTRFTVPYGIPVDVLNAEQYKTANGLMSGRNDKVIATNSRHGHYSSTLF